MSGYICARCQIGIRQSRSIQKLQIMAARYSSTEPQLSEGTEGLKPLSIRRMGTKEVIESKRREKGVFKRLDLNPGTLVDWKPKGIPWKKKSDFKRLELGSTGSSEPLDNNAVEGEKLYAKTPSSFKSIESLDNNAVEGKKISSKTPSRIEELLAKPTWSVCTLLPDPDLPPVEEISSKTLHHLLRLAALPLPKSAEEEASMLKTLHSQLHFVRNIQEVDTEGVEPLQSLRDETEAGKAEATIGLESLKGVLENEVVVGRMGRRRRRRDGPVPARTGGEGEPDWDVFGTARETVDVPGSGRYFVVRSGKERAVE